MKNEDLFEALSDIDEELVASAKNINGSDERVIVTGRTPLWKMISGGAAAAACVAALVVGGVFGVNYINDKKAVPPASDPASGTNMSVIKDMAFAPVEYPEDAKYIYDGDYTELSFGGRPAETTVSHDAVESLEELEKKAAVIVIGEFVDDPHQTLPLEYPGYDEGTLLLHNINGRSYNKFRVDKAIKGNCVEGEEILICQNGFVRDNEYLELDNLTPMIKGDKWIYFLERSGDNGSTYPFDRTYLNTAFDEGDGSYYPVGGSDGRFPVPGEEHEFVLNDNVYGVFDMQEFHGDVYEDIKNKLPDWTIASNVTVICAEGNMENCSWTMEEFPGIEFTYSDYVVYSMDENGDWEHLYIAVSAGYLKSIYLADLNGDGNREIISSMSCGDMSSIRLYDYANKQGYTLEEFEEYNYKLIYANDGLSFYKEEYPNSRYIESGALSLDNMEKMAVYSLGVVGEGFQKIDVPYENNYIKVSFEMSEFGGLTFDVSNGGGYGWSQGVGYSDGATDYALYFDNIITDLYLCDINGDGYRELCSTAIDKDYDKIKPDRNVVHVYDMRNGIEYELSDFSKNYSLDEPNNFGQMMVAIKYDDTGHTNYERLRLSDMENLMRPLNAFLQEDLTGTSGYEAFRYYRKYRPDDDNTVYFVSPGKVLYSGKINPNGGNSAVIVEFEDNLYCYYNLVSLADINVGDEVKVGQEIGSAGYNLWLGVIGADILETNDIGCLVNQEIDEEASAEPDIAPVSGKYYVEDLSDEPYISPKYDFMFKYLNADENAAVYSTVNGIVDDICADGYYNGGHGNYVAILGDDGKYYYFSALGSVDAELGQRVSAGQQIGTVGTSGTWYLEDGFGVRYAGVDHKLSIKKSTDVALSDIAE